MREPILTPPANTDHAALAGRACERALDGLVVAQDGGLTDPEAADLFTDAAAAFDEARRQCLFAAAALLRAYRKQQEARGLVQCPRCRAWKHPEAMEALEIGYQKQGEDSVPRSVYRSCRGGCDGSG